MLADEKVVLFTFFAWSGQALASLRIFEAWRLEWLAAHPEALVAFYRLDPDAHPETWPWLTEQTRTRHGSDSGFGSVMWLRRPSATSRTLTTSTFAGYGAARAVTRDSIPTELEQRTPALRTWGPQARQIHVGEVAHRTVYTVVRDGD